MGSATVSAQTGVEPITSFREEFGFLSNFSLLPGWPTVYGGVRTAEHLFQSYKTLDEQWRVWILNAPTAQQAKQRGRECPLRPDWESIKLQSMARVVAWKFTPGTVLADKLIATAPRELIEGNTWGDRYWGRVDGEGENWLGALLMGHRSDLIYGTAR